MKQKAQGIIIAVLVIIAIIVLLGFLAWVFSYGGQVGQIITSALIWIIVGIVAVIIIAIFIKFLLNNSNSGD